MSSRGKILRIGLGEVVAGPEGDGRPVTGPNRGLAGLRAFEAKGQRLPLRSLLQRLGNQRRSFQAVLRGVRARHERPIKAIRNLDRDLGVGANQAAQLHQ